MKQSARVLGFVCACALAHAASAAVCGLSYVVKFTGDGCNEETLKAARLLDGTYAAAADTAKPTQWTKKITVKDDQQKDEEKTLTLEINAQSEWTLVFDIESASGPCTGDRTDGEKAADAKKKEEAEAAANALEDETAKEAALAAIGDWCLPLPSTWECTTPKLGDKCVMSVAQVSGGMAWWMWLMIVAAVSVIVGLIVWCLMCRNGDEGAQNNHGQAVTGIELAAAGS